MQQLKQIITTLVALFAMTTGAWADGTLLTTINASADFTNGSKTFDNIVTVTLDDVSYDANDGWYCSGSPHPVEVAPVNGVTVTGYVLYFSATDPLEYEGSSFEVALEGNRVLADDISTQLGSVGITKIEVYGTAAPAGTALNHDATRKVWTLDAMPAGNVELQVAYYPGMLTLAASPADGGKVELDAAAAPVEWTPETWTNVSTQGQHDALTSGDITLSTTDGWLVKASDGNLTLYSADNEYDHQTLTFSTTGDGFTRIELTMTSDASNHNPHITPADGWTFSGKSAVWEGEATKSLVCQNCTTTVSKITFYRGSGLPTGVEKDETGNIYVKSGTTVTVKATPEEGYHLVSLSDGTNTYEVDADGIATVTMPEGDADLTLTATFSDEFELTFDDVNFKTNANITVKVGDEAKTLDQDGKLSVKSGQTVTLTAKQGYKFRDVSVKKAGAAKPALSINIGDASIHYNEGESWKEAIQKYPTENAGWSIDGNTVKYNGNYTLCYDDWSGSAVFPQAIIDATEAYKLVTVN